ncbi:hypothetical protein VCHA53O466_40319 [Vibrio chagasii]|nr:hypothetical protein VCHA53O466_40319 [Vibrio chagasii]
MAKLSKRQSERLVTLDTPNLLAGYRGDKESELYTPERHRIFELGVQALILFPKLDARNWALRYLKGYEINRLESEGVLLGKKELSFKRQRMSDYVPDGASVPVFSHTPEKLLHEFQHWRDLSDSVSAIDNYNYDYQSPPAVIADFTKYEKDWRVGLERDVALTGNEEILLEHDGLHLFNLNKSGCSIEGNSMGHCGNGSGKDGQLVLSVRSKRDGGRYRPHATLILNNVVRGAGGEIISADLGETKGRGNDTISPKYREIIAEFLSKTPAVKSKIEGTYMPEADLTAPDFSPEQVSRIVEGNPSYFKPIEVYYALRDSDSPIFKKSVEAYAESKGVELDHESSSVIYDARDPRLLESALKELSVRIPNLDHAAYITQSIPDLEMKDALTYKNLMDNLPEYKGLKTATVFHAAIIMGANGFKDSPEIIAAHSAFREYQGKLLSKTWSKVASVVNEHVEGVDYQVSDNFISKKMDIFASIAAVAEHNLIEIAKSDDERAMQLTGIYDDESSVFGVESDFWAASRAMEKALYSNITEQNLGLVIESGFDSSNPYKEVDSSVIDDICDLVVDIEINRDKHCEELSRSFDDLISSEASKHDLAEPISLPYLMDEEVDHEGDFCIVDTSDNRVFNEQVLKGDKGIRPMRPFNRIFGAGSDITGAIVIGRVEGDRVTPINVIPRTNAVNTPKDESSSDTFMRVSTCLKSEMKSEVSGIEAISIGRLLSRNTDLIQGLSPSLSSTSASELLRVVSCLKTNRAKVDVSDLDEKTTLFDLCMSAQVKKSSFSRDVSDGVTEGALHACLLRSQVSALRALSGINLENASSMISESGLDGKIVSSLLSDDIDMQAIIDDALLAVVENINDKYGQGYDLDLLDSHWRSVSDIKSKGAVNAMEHNFNEVVSTHLTERFELILSSGVQEAVLNEIKAVASIKLKEEADLPVSLDEKPSLSNVKMHKPRL